ncbi:MAG TPA: hypothetical protein VMO17_23800, partial [Terriglobia bacterium]|nr:hypothetical protein [Terriglobia bacterium]
PTPLSGSLPTRLGPRAKEGGDGDGAEWIWNLAAEHFPGAIQIVDLYNAPQHLWDLNYARIEAEPASEPVS